MKADLDPLAPYRSKLLGLGYRMLGSRADAEDVLQDAYLRFRDAREVRNTEAFLTTTVTRLCLDRLKSARRARETYVGPWLPEPVIDDAALSPQAATELADDLSFALMLALERLSPTERAAFLLHDVFDARFSDVASILGKSEAACRQLATRARKAVRAARPSAPVSPETHARLLLAFSRAAASGDIAALTALLREDAVLFTDGGGKTLTALRPIRGAEKITRFFVGVAKKFAGRPSDFRAEFRAINGVLGGLAFIDGKVVQTLSLAVDGEKIVAIYIVQNPEKLSGLAVGPSERT
jgi:RNA polymerase sigma-70 factor, ECF subfamily